MSKNNTKQQALQRSTNKSKPEKKLTRKNMKKHQKKSCEIYMSCTVGTGSNEDLESTIPKGRKKTC